MSRHTTGFAACLVLVVCLGCRGGDKPARVDPPGVAVVSDAPRSPVDAAATEGMAELVRGNTSFSLDLLRAVDSGDGNVMIAPHSLSVALAMAYAGAGGTTKQQMADVLHFGLPDAGIHAAFSGLDAELAQRDTQSGSRGPDPDARPFTLDIVNQAFAQQGFAFLPTYLDTLAANYGAELRLMDFVGDAQGCGKDINKWVERRTGKRITDLVSPDDVDGTTTLVLVNAVYFLADWAAQFEAEDTRPGVFHPTAGAETSCSMMHQTSHWPYAEGEGYQAVEMRYVGDEVSMVIILPEPGEIDAFIGDLNADRFSEIVSSLAACDVQLSLPKFEMASEFKLEPALAQLGMVDAFDHKRADFSGMTTEAPLWISDVLHKTFVTVDEEGTEAAASSAVMMMKGGMLPEVEMTVDHPFLFAIRDRVTDAVLFLGCVRDPSA